MSSDCLFCRIVSGEVPAAIVAQNEYCIAFRDINPQAPVHLLVIPRAHVRSLSDATDAAQIGQVALFAAEVAKHEGIAESGYRTVINTNADAGQTVFHIHAHVLGGRRLAWPPG
ncbi:MAG: histidine triad nucleotide-binding protein [Gemmatimonadaceae bacterium]